MDKEKIENSIIHSEKDAPRIIREDERGKFHYFDDQTKVITTLKPGEVLPPEFYPLLEDEL